MVWGCTLRWGLEDIVWFHIWVERRRNSYLNAYGPQIGWTPKPGFSVLQWVQGVASVPAFRQSPCLLTGISALTCQHATLTSYIWNVVESLLWLSTKERVLCKKTRDFSFISQAVPIIGLSYQRIAFPEGGNRVLGCRIQGKSVQEGEGWCVLERSSHVVVRYPECGHWSRSSQRDVWSDDRILRKLSSTF